jgi:hypothetical protein
MRAPPPVLQRAAHPTAPASDGAAGAARDAGPRNHPLSDQPRNPLAGARHRRRTGPGARQRNRRRPAGPALLPSRSRHDGSVWWQRPTTEKRSANERSGRQLATALAATRSDDGPPGTAAHAQPEPVGPRTATVVRLKRALALGHGCRSPGARCWSSGIAGSQLSRLRAVVACRHRRR